MMNMEVVEQVAELALFLQACCVLLCPGGLMVIATINRTLLSPPGAIVLANYVLGWLARGPHHWSKLPKPDELTALPAAESLEVKAKTRVHVNPLTRNFKFGRSSAISDLLTALQPG